MAKRTINDDVDDSKIKKTYEKGLENILPEEFNIFSVVANGKKIVANMKQLMEIKNTENKQEIISTMNRASTHFFYFGNVKAKLENELASEEEAFALWKAESMNRYVDEDSEKARERKLMAEKTEDYESRKKKIRDLKMFLSYSEVAYKSFDKNIDLLRSIGRMVAGEQQRTKDNEGFNLPADDE